MAEGVLQFRVTGRELLERLSENGTIEAFDLIGVLEVFGVGDDLLSLKPHLDDAGDVVFTWRFDSDSHSPETSDDQADKQAMCQDLIYWKDPLLPSDAAAAPLECKRVTGHTGVHWTNLPSHVAWTDRLDSA